MEGSNLLNSRHNPRQQPPPVVKALRAARLALEGEALMLQEGKRYGALLELVGRLLEVEGLYECLLAA